MPNRSVDAQSNGHRSREPTRLSFPSFAHEGGQKTYFPEAAKGIIFEGKRGLDNRVLTTRAVASMIEYPEEMLPFLSPKVRAAVLAQSLSRFFPSVLLEKMTGITPANLADHQKTLDHTPTSVRQAITAITQHTSLLLSQSLERNQPAYKLAKKPVFATPEQEAAFLKARKKSIRKRKPAEKTETASPTALRRKVS